MKMTSRKILSVLLAVIMVLSIVPMAGVSSFAETSGDFEYYVLSETDKTCKITDYTGSAANLTIPSEIDGYTVTSIGEQALRNCTSLTSVTIPDSVIEIGMCAFEDCASLANITIPDSVTSIGNETFDNTAYYNNESNWENGALYIGKHLIKAKRFISGSYAVKSGTKTIADYTFYDCSLTSIIIPNSVTSIGDWAFAYCELLTSITIPDRVTSIGGYVFYNCTSLTSVTISDSVMSIGSSAFEGCTSLASITMPNSVTSIGGFAFYNCTSLTSVIIPDSVTDIGGYAFEGCISLASIVIPDSVTSIQVHMLSSGQRRKNIPLFR